jgi:hypothetical protein
MPANAISLNNVAFLASLGGGSGLSDDTSLSVFTIAGQTPTLVSPGVYTVDLANSYFEYADADILDVSTITATHPGATVGHPLFVPDNLGVGDNEVTFTVTAEDGVTVQNYTLTIHVLNVGTPATLAFTALNSFGGVGTLTVNGVARTWLAGGIPTGTDIFVDNSGFTTAGAMATALAAAFNAYVPTSASGPDITMTTTETGSSASLAFTAPFGNFTPTDGSATGGAPS